MLHKHKCVECEKEFFGRPDAKFCGPACYREGMRKLNRIRNRDKEYREKAVYPAAMRWRGKKR